MRVAVVSYGACGVLHGLGMATSRSRSNKSGNSLTRSSVGLSNDLGPRYSNDPEIEFAPAGASAGRVLH
jgi:hypothetical protein